MTFLQALREQRVVGIVRSATADLALSNGRQLLASGIRCVEVSLVTPGAVDVISQLLQDRHQHRAAGAEPSFIGAGTVLNRADVRAVRVAGAEFIVTPNLSAPVVHASVAAGIPIVPGVFTPSEALEGIQLGASAAKLFPASAWSPAAVRDLLAALPSLELVPTGGISVNQAPDWIAAGAMAVGMGSALTRGGPDSAVATCAELLDMLKKAR